MTDPLAGGGLVAFQVPGAEPLDPGHGCSAAPRTSVWNALFNVF
jgi:hypothetical protein